MTMGQSGTAKKAVIVCGVLLLSMLAAFWMLSKISLNEHECFVSVTAREMLQSGDWIMPTCNGEPRLQKTPLSYWLVGGFAKLTGKVDEFTARLPSAIFAFLSAVAILYFVNQWLSLRVAAISAAVWVTSLSYIRYSHDARPEMSLTFFVTLCFLSFYSAVTAISRKKQVIFMLVFWVSFGLANLAKGPAPLPLVLLPLFFYIAVFKKWRLLPRLLPVVGVLIFLAIVLPWPVAIGHKVNWNLIVWKKEFVDRFFGNYDSGHKPIYYYLYVMFQFIIPWVAFLPMALAAPFYRVWRNKSSVIQFCWMWFVVDLVFLTIDGGKRQHYILPLMPAMTILIGIILNDMIFVRKVYGPSFTRNVLCGHIIVIIMAAIGGPIFVARFEPQLLTKTIILSIMTIALFSVLALQFVFRRPGLACTVIFSSIVVWFMVTYGSFEGLFDRNQYSEDFLKKVAEIVPANGNLIAYKYTSKKSVHYLGRIIPVVTERSLLDEHYEKGDWVIATSDYLDELLRDVGFRIVYYKENAAYRGHARAPAALLHKAPPTVRDSTGNELQAGSISPSR
jgi:4-amino-4-deoxy-L-arabinose transferase-like glycosyltransferase